MDLYFQEHDVALNERDGNPRRAGDPNIDAAIRSELRQFAIQSASERLSSQFGSDQTAPANPGPEFFLNFLQDVRHNAQGTGAPGSSSVPPASESVIKNLPQVPARPATDPKTKASARSCPVCTDDFNTLELVTRLPCGHDFHRDCVTNWLRRNCTCPLCRRELKTDDEEYETLKKLERRTAAAIQLNAAMYN